MVHIITTFVHTNCARGGKIYGNFAKLGAMDELFRAASKRCENTGMPKKMIEQAAVQIGEYLAKNVDPQNEQERVLSDLWAVAEKDEKQAIASCVMKLVQQKTTH